MKFKNLRRDDDCITTESKLAGEFLERTIDHYDDIPEGMRVIVVVASGDGKGKMGCAFEGYDSDERLALDLQLLSQAVDLGVSPATEEHDATAVRLASTVDAHVEATQKHNEERARLRDDLDGARAALRREQDARAQLRVELDRTKADLAEAQMLCRDARIQAMDRGASYQAAVAEPENERAQHSANVEQAVARFSEVAGGAYKARVAERDAAMAEVAKLQLAAPVMLTVMALLADEADLAGLREVALWFYDLDPEHLTTWTDAERARAAREQPKEPCCPSSTLPGGTHDIGCRGTGKVH